MKPEVATIMDLTEIDAIPSPSDPHDQSDFEIVRAVVRRHVLAEGNTWFAHGDLECAVDRRRAAAAERERDLLRPLAVLSPSEHLSSDADLVAARERKQAYAALLAALTRFCAVTCTPRDGR